jgi:flagellar basal body-associated protein FliL
MWRTLQVLLTLFNIAFAILAVYFIQKGGVITPQSQALDYKDFVTILLTGIAVMIAVGAVAVALFAVWGFSALREEARESARRAAEARIDELVPSLVEKALKFDREAAGAEADQIAQEYGKEDR